MHQEEVQALGAQRQRLEAQGTLLPPYRLPFHHYLPPLPPFALHPSFRPALLPLLLLLLHLPSLQPCQPRRPRLFSLPEHPPRGRKGTAPFLFPFSLLLFPFLPPPFQQRHGQGGPQRPPSLPPSLRPSLRPSFAPPTSLPTRHDPILGICAREKGRPILSHTSHRGFPSALLRLSAPSNLAPGRRVSSRPSLRRLLRLPFTLLLLFIFFFLLFLQHLLLLLLLLLLHHLGSGSQAAPKPPSAPGTPLVHRGARGRNGKGGGRGGGAGRGGDLLFHSVAAHPVPLFLLTRCQSFLVVLLLPHTGNTVSFPIHRR
ncbi:hypothetical protein Naga_101344g2 [Nannochloropsis gaditana]|uniref:Uncharacterized protein n=1 Tax=Nannochloropsis gaditana TaxID=72520 RepID=W7TU04_9STRA|nr:hypothetical protein Naga_101344g2 [Nannochloropsis gaditana]